MSVHKLFKKLFSRKRRTSQRHPKPSPIQPQQRQTYDDIPQGLHQSATSNSITEASKLDLPQLPLTWSASTLDFSMVLTEVLKAGADSAEEFHQGISTQTVVGAQQDVSAIDLKQDAHWDDNLKPETKPCSADRHFVEPAVFRLQNMRRASTFPNINMKVIADSMICTLSFTVEDIRALAPYDLAYRHERQELNEHIGTSGRSSSLGDFNNIHETQGSAEDFMCPDFPRNGVATVSRQQTNQHLADESDTEDSLSHSSSCEEFRHSSCQSSQPAPSDIRSDSTSDLPYFDYSNELIQSEQFPSAYSRFDSSKEDSLDNSPSGFKTPKHDVTRDPWKSVDTDLSAILNKIHRNEAKRKLKLRIDKICLAIKTPFIKCHYLIKFSLAKVRPSDFAVERGNRTKNADWNASENIWYNCEAMNVTEAETGFLRPQATAIISTNDGVPFMITRAPARGSHIPSVSLSQIPGNTFGNDEGNPNLEIPHRDVMSEIQHPVNRSTGEDVDLIRSRPGAAKSDYSCSYTRH